MDIQTSFQAAIREDIRHKPFAATTQLNETRTIAPPPFQCPICFTFFSDPENMNKHIESVHEKPMIRNGVESHVASVQERNKPLFVENGGFNGSGMKQVHNKILPIGSVPLLDIQTTIQAAICEVAHKPFADTTQLNNLKRRKAPFQNYFECKACSKSYSCVENLKKHIESVHEKKMTHDDVVKSHFEKKPYKCDTKLENSQICDYVFNQKNDLINHLILAHGFSKP